MTNLIVKTLTVVGAFTIAKMIYERGYEEGRHDQLYVDMEYEKEMREAK